MQKQKTPVTMDWWDDILPVRPHLKPPGKDDMLRLVAYDIADPKRLRRVAAVCLNYGIRVQRSLFECWLTEDQFTELWQQLLAEFNEEEDQLVAYPIDARQARQRITAGHTMTCTEEISVYYVGDADSS